MISTKQNILDFLSNDDKYYEFLCRDGVDDLGRRGNPTAEEIRKKRVEIENMTEKQVKDLRRRIQPINTQELEDKFEEVSSKLVSIEENSSQLGSKPCVTYSIASLQSIANNTAINVLFTNQLREAFTGKRYKQTSFSLADLNLSTNNNGIFTSTSNDTNLLFVSYQVRFSEEDRPAGLRHAWISLASGEYGRTQVNPLSTTTYLSSSAIIRLNRNDIFSVNVLHTNGSAISLINSINSSTKLTILAL
jgi:hypothetical protein